MIWCLHRIYSKKKESIDFCHQLGSGIVLNYVLALASKTTSTVSYPIGLAMTTLTSTLTLFKYKDSAGKVLLRSVVVTYFTFILVKGMTLIFTSVFILSLIVTVILSPYLQSGEPTVWRDGSEQPLSFFCPPVLKYWLLLNTKYPLNICIHFYWNLAQQIHSGTWTEKKVILWGICHASSVEMTVGFLCLWSGLFLW